MQPGEVIEISQDNAESEEMEFILLDPNGVEVASDASFDALTDTSSADVAYGYYYTVTGGTFVLQFDNDSSTTDRTNQTVTITSITPTPVGSFDVGQTIAAMDTTPLPKEKRLFFQVDLLSNALVEGTLEDNGGSNDLEFYVYDAVTGANIYSSETTGDEDISFVGPMGSHIIAIRPDDEVTGGYNLNLMLNTPPFLEVEPNDGVATATVIPAGTVNFAGTASEDVAGDQDFYSIMTTATSAMQIDCERRTEAGFPFVEIWIMDSAGNVLEHDSSSAVSAAAVMQANETYTIHIGGDSTTFDVTYAYFCTITDITAISELDTEPNGVGMPQSVMTPVNLLGTVAGVESDVYSFTVATAGDYLVDIAALGDNDTISTSYDIMDSTGTSVLAGSGALSTSVNMPAGTYTLTLSQAAADDEGNGYDVDIMVDSFTNVMESANDNGSFAMAEDLTAISLPLNISGNAEAGGADQDYFSFTLAQPLAANQALVLDISRPTTTGTTGSVNFELFDAAQTSLGGPSDSFTLPKSFDFTGLAAGQYFVRIYRTSTLATLDGLYDLQIQVQ